MGERPTDSVIEYYDAYHRPEERGFDLRHLRDGRVYQRLGQLLKPGMRVLDVGCGDGHSFGPWAKDNDIKYVGVDIAPSAVELATAAGFEAHVVADSGKLPFPDASFDAAVSIEVIEHLFDPTSTIHEAVRIIKPGGQVIVTTPNVAYWRRRADLALLGRWNPFGYSLAVEEPWRDPHIRFWNPRALGRFLRKVGLEDIRVMGHGGSLLGDIPWLPRKWRPNRGGPPYRMMEARFPALFACFLMGVGRRPHG